MLPLVLQLVLQLALRWCRRRRHGRCRCFYRSGLSLQSWIMHFISLHKSLCNHRTNYHSPPIAEISIRRQNSSKHRLIQNQISATLSQIPNNICCPSLMCITTICSHICAIYICPVTKAINNYKFAFLRIFQYSGNLCLCQSSFNIDYSYCFGRCHIVVIL